MTREEKRKAAEFYRTRIRALYRALGVLPVKCQWCDVTLWWLNAKDGTVAYTQDGAPHGDCRGRTPQKQYRQGDFRWG